MAIKNSAATPILLDLPPSLRERAEEMASSERLSLGLFVATAIAEALQRKQLQRCLDTAENPRPVKLPPDDGAALIH
jgi:hypothetical protein